MTNLTTKIRHDEFDDEFGDEFADEKHFLTNLTTKIRRQIRRDEFSLSNSSKSVFGGKFVVADEDAFIYILQYI